MSLLRAMRWLLLCWIWAWVDKTVISLSAIADLMWDKFEVGKVLVVCPLRVGAVWKNEVKKWDHLQEVRVSVAIGTEKERRVALLRDADVYVINRENVGWLVEKSGVELNFDMLIIDELSSFKNSQSKRFKALMKLRPKVKRVVGLTGTPASNGLMDLFAEYKVLDKGVRLGRFISRYRESYFRPDKTNGLVVYSYKPLPFAEEAIFQKIGDITISMKAGDFLEMPEKVVSEYVVELEEKEKRVYEKFKRDLVLSVGDDEITAVNAASLCGKLTQMANGAVYTDDGKVEVFHERKLDALEDMIEAANGKPVMVVYWYKHDLERIGRRLTERGIEFEKLDKEDSVERWNRGEIPVLLLNPQSAGHGLNLQSGGSFIIWFSLPWSLELYQQTNGRLWRQGQKEKTVVISHIITKNSVDERILQVLKGKDATQEELLDAVKADLGGA